MGFDAADHGSQGKGNLSQRFRFLRLVDFLARFGLAVPPCWLFGIVPGAASTPVCKN